MRVHTHIVIYGVLILALLIIGWNCLVEPPKRPLYGYRILDMTSKDQLDDNLGRRVRVTGQITRYKMGPQLNAIGTGFDLLNWDCPDELDGPDVWMTGILGIVDAHVVPDSDLPRDWLQTNEFPGDLIPDLYTLSDIKVSLREP